MTTPESLQKALDLHRAGQLELAERMYRQLVAAEPNNAPAWHLLGVTAQQRGQHGSAVESIGRAIELDRNQVAFHANLALANAALGRVEEAVAAMRQVIRLQPNEPKPHDDMGLLLARLGRWDEAAECFRHALAIRPDYATAHNNLGNTLNQQGRPREALECFRAAVRAQPDLVGAYNNLANTLKSLGQIDEAIGLYREALRRAPDYVAAKHNLARALAAWNGSPLEGRTILIRCSHGLGDTLQFVRYVPEVRRRGAGRILLAAPDVLHPFLSEASLAELVSPQAEGLEFDVEVSVMDLPCLIRSAEETIPAAPYLRANEPLVAKWRETLAGLGGFQVGIAWQGNRNYAWDHWRSIPLAEFEPLSGVPGVRLISLQKGDGCQQLPQGRFAVTDLGDAFDRQAAFMDTAAIIANLDLVITSDTAVAHLAGALGAPVWVALPFDADWRWQSDREDTRWYATMRLFRQSQRGDWAGVFARIKDALAACKVEQSPGR